MPNIFKRFLDAENRREWLVLYLAHKLDVQIHTNHTEIETETPEAEEPDVEENAHDLSPRKELDKYVDESELVVSRDINGGYWITHKSDRVIGASLRRGGQFQEHAIDDCLALLDRLGVKTERKVFLDVGANIGTHSLHAARLGFERVLSLEPNPVNFKLLEANVVLNGFGDTVCCRNFAASKEAGSTSMEISPSNFGDHRLSPRKSNSASIHGENDWNSVEVSVTTVDDLMEFEGVVPEALSLVWIDTQGHEGHVLAGAKQLRSTRCPVIIEFWPYGLDRSGGYELLKSALVDYNRIIDLAACGQNEVRELNPQDLDVIFETMLSSESNHGSPHTDLLLLK